MGSILRPSVACGACGFEAIPGGTTAEKSNRRRSPSHPCVCTSQHSIYSIWHFSFNFNFQFGRKIKTNWQGKPSSYYVGQIWGFQPPFHPRGSNHQHLTDPCCGMFKRTDLHLHLYDNDIWVFEQSEHGTVPHCHAEHFFAPTRIFLFCPHGYLHVLHELVFVTHIYQLDCVHLH